MPPDGRVHGLVQGAVRFAQHKADRYCPLCDVYWSQHTGQVCWVCGRAGIVPKHGPIVYGMDTTYTFTGDGNE
jgi:hypothetical protein